MHSFTTPNNPQLPNLYCLIVAAGKGSRFGHEMPKQYLSINEQTLVQHCVDKLAQSRYVNRFVDKCHLVIASDDNLAQQLTWAMPMQFVIGGEERWQSVACGVAAIAHAGATEDDLVLIHDAARPCVKPADIDQVIQVALDEAFGAILATPVVDTLKQVGENQRIERTIDRQHLWQAQTPQVFRFGALREVLAEVTKQGLMITDEASGFEQLGYQVRVVAGSRNNIKLTYADDLALLTALLTNES